MSHTLRFGFLLFPDLRPLDLIGPAEVFNAAPNTEIHLAWKTLDPIATSGGWRLCPTTTFADCPQMDVICAPGGVGQIALMDDDETLDFLRRQAAGARYVTSVCTGSLILGAAGLLKGYRAACHWMSRDQLALLGATPVADRVVKDRNRITGSGATAGIDFGLALIAELCGVEEAKCVQLDLEYDPQPPFKAGSPERASRAMVDKTMRKFAERQTRRLAATKSAAARLK